MIRREDRDRVVLKHYTPIDIALEAGLVCTASEDSIGKYSAKEFISRLISNGHESVIEHICYTFIISGISRAMLQELARHRHISLSVQSTRWALKKLLASGNKIDTESMFFDDIELEDEVSDENAAKLHEIQSKYESILSDIAELSSSGVRNDILKYYLPESIETKLMLTLNARELRHIFSLRSKAPALQEFRDWSCCVYDALPEEHRFMYSEFFDV